MTRNVWGTTRRAWGNKRIHENTSLYRFCDRIDAAYWHGLEPDGLPPAETGNNNGVRYPKVNLAEKDRVYSDEEEKELRRLEAQKEKELEDDGSLLYWCR